MVITDPPPTSLEKEKEEGFFYVLGVTHDMWYVTPDKWHMTCDMWHIFSKFQFLSSFGCVCRAAPATPGPLKSTFLVKNYLNVAGFIDQLCLPKTIRSLECVEGNGFCDK